MARLHVGEAIQAHTYTRSEGIEAEHEYFEIKLAKADMPHHVLAIINSLEEGDILLMEITMTYQGHEDDPALIWRQLAMERNAALKRAVIDLDVANPTHGSTSKDPLTGRSFRWDAELFVWREILSTSEKESVDG